MKQQQQYQTAACKAYKTGRERRSYGVLQPPTLRAPATMIIISTRRLGSTAHAYNATWPDASDDDIIFTRASPLLRLRITPRGGPSCKLCHYNAKGSSFGVWEDMPATGRATD